MMGPLVTVACPFLMFATTRERIDALRRRVPVARGSTVTIVRG